MAVERNKGQVIPIRERIWAEEIELSRSIYHTALEKYKVHDAVQSDGLTTLIQSLRRQLNTANIEMLNNNPRILIDMVGATIEEYANQPVRPLSKNIKGKSYLRLDQKGMTIDEARSLALFHSFDGEVHDLDDIAILEGVSTKYSADRKITSAKREIVQKLQPTNNWWETRQSQDWGMVESRFKIPTWEDQMKKLKGMVAGMDLMVERRDGVAVMGLDKLYTEIMKDEAWKNPVSQDVFIDYVKSVLVQSLQYHKEPYKVRPAQYKLTTGSIKITYDDLPDTLLKPDSVYMVIAAYSLDGRKRTPAELNQLGGGRRPQAIIRSTLELSQALSKRFEK